MMKYVAGAAALAVVAGLGLTYAVTLQASGDPFDPCRATTIAGGVGTIGGPFTLVSETGQTVTDEDVIDRPALIYFGYTFCPDVCPLDTVRNADAVDLLADQGHEVRPVFISVDPKRDTPEVLGEFTDLVHDDMLGLTGSADQVEAAAGAYKAYFRAHDGGGEFYLVDHSTFSYLMLPGHGFVEFFRRDASAEDMADKMACFIDAAT
ncbi:MAG: SCO family protein [Pseudomonadota bacterium]